jgi:Domain of unknown function (DUF5916)
MRHVVLLVFALALLTTIIPTHNASAQPLLPQRVDTPPILDGRLDEPIWRQAEGTTGFKTFHPDFGVKPVAATYAYTAYDSDNLYFAFRCLEEDPAKIKTSVTSRDNMFSDDWICLNLDTFGDHQSLYAFYVNPDGIQGDSRFTAGVEDNSIDMVWHSAGRVNDDGYTIELAIPLKSIRFADGDPVQMAVFFERHVSRRSEHQSWPPFDPARGMAFLTQMHDMQYEGLQQKRLLELLPAATYHQTYKREAGEMVSDETHRDLSLTGKYGLTSDLILDATINPDFSQVEADAGQVDVNLRHDLYFAEKRPFFLEGRENFKVAGTAISELDPLRSVVYTRQIVDPDAGLKLAGKLGDKTTIASLYAVDELPDNSPEGDQAHFQVLRLKHALSGDSFLGGVYTGREIDKGFNRVGGLDGRIRLGESTTLGFSGLLAKTDDGVCNDTGHAVASRVQRENRNIYLALAAREISDDFTTNTGYMTRTGIRQFSALARPKFYTENDFVQRVDLEGFTAQSEDLFSNRWETFNHVSGQVYFGGTSTVKLKYSNATEIFAGERFDIGGFHAYAASQFSKKVYAGILYRRVDAISYNPANPLQGWSNRLSIDLEYQPSDKLSLYFSHIRFDFHRESDDHEVYDYPIYHTRLTYQLNKYLFLRGIVEFNEFRDEVLTDLLASFTYIPGTVLHVGYGSLHDQLRWDGSGQFYERDDVYHEKVRGVFVKASYLWRL